MICDFGTRTLGKDVGGHPLRCVIFGLKDKKIIGGTSCDFLFCYLKNRKTLGGHPLQFVILAPEFLKKT